MNISIEFFGIPGISGAVQSRLIFFCSTTIQLSPAPRLPHGDDFSEFSHENDHLMVKLMLQLWLNSPFYGPQIIGPGNPTCYQLF